MFVIDNGTNERCCALLCCTVLRCAALPCAVWLPLVSMGCIGEPTHGSPHTSWLTEDYVRSTFAFGSGHEFEDNGKGLVRGGKSCAYMAYTCAKSAP